MVTIENSPHGFSVKFSWPGGGVRGFRKTVRSLDDAVILLKHHYGKKHDRRRCLFCKEEK